MMDNKEDLSLRMKKALRAVEVMEEVIIFIPDDEDLEIIPIESLNIMED